MIKLLATDMDGTLLNSKKEPPEKLAEALRQLQEAGIIFVVASGRQYYNLKDVFPGFEKYITFISENGSLIFEDDRNIFHSKIKSENMIEPLLAVRKIKTAFPVYCGINYAYIEDDDPVLLKTVGMYYKNVRCIPDLTWLSTNEADDIICKIAIFDCECAETNAYPAVSKFEKDMQVAVSGINWVDLTEPGINKGGAIRFLQNKYNIKPSECMSFGDYLNDLEMMECCEHSYAVFNAHPKIKEVSRYITDSNDNNGVFKILVKEGLIKL